MGVTTIEWADYTFNCWIGCTKVSPACAHCYAESFAKRTGKAKWGPNGTRVVTSADYWKKPYKWNAEASESGVRKRVFCASLADVFEDWDGPMMGGGRDDGELAIDDNRTRLLTMDDVRARLFKLIDETPWLDWLLLTKRPENIRRMWPTDCVDGDFSTGESRLIHADRKNVWLGTTVENQEFADKRIPELLKCRDLATVLFLSMEPLLGPVDLTRYWVEPECSCYEVISGGHQMGCMFYGMSSEQIHAINSAPPNGPDWIITGGESGPGARPTNPDWFRSIRDQCAAANVPYLHKQNGEFVLLDPKDVPRSARQAMRPGEEAEVFKRVGKDKAGRLLDGIEHNGFPVVEANA